MKICLFSDIHGNRYAFTVALPQIKKICADINIFLGDICGYYFEPITIWRDLLSLPNLIAILGNHDNFFLDCIKNNSVPESYTQKYGPALKFLIQNNSAEQKEFLQWIRQLKPHYTDPDGLFSCYHGGPASASSEYLYPDSPLPKTKERYIFTGHTHYPMLRTNGETIFCNPGSIGQPRQGGNPTFATLEIDGSHYEWELHQFSYDKASLLSSLAAHINLPPYLSNILQR